MVVGIDLGTTNSLISCISEGRVKIISNALGENLTPSVVSIGNEGEVFIGKVARERLATHPLSTFSVFKRTIGTKKRYQAGVFEFSSAELSSFILKSLVADAEKFLGRKVDEAVISVPAYFNNSQRQDTLFAAKLAGLKVRRLVNEPTAAAITYGILDQNDSTSLIFDLGGGTFDLSIIESFEGLLEIHASGGNTFLGGNDFTNILYRRIVGQLEKNDKIQHGNLSKKTQALLAFKAEKAKLLLSKTDVVEDEINIDGQSLKFRLTASDLESDSIGLQDTMCKLIERGLRDSKISVSGIDQVILVGGATRMPLIKRLIVKLFGKLPLCHINPDEVVCMGASYLAAILEKDPYFKDKVVTDVTPYSLGVGSLDLKLGQEHFSPILDRNTVVPCSREEVYQPIHANQSMISFNIYQGESRRLCDNVLIGRLEVPIHKKPATEELFSVRFTYDSSGLLEVLVTSLSTKKVYQSVFKQDNLDLSSDEIETILRKLSCLKIHPRDQEENRFILEKIHRLYEELLGGSREFLGHTIGEFEKALESQDPHKIMAKRSEIITFLESINELI